MLYPTIAEALEGATAELRKEFPGLHRRRWYHLYCEVFAVPVGHTAVVEIASDDHEIDRLIRFILGETKSDS